MIFKGRRFRKISLASRQVSPCPLISKIQITILMLAAAGFAESVERVTQEREVSGAGLLGVRIKVLSSPCKWRDLLVARIIK